MSLRALMFISSLHMLIMLLCVCVCSNKRLQPYVCVFTPCGSPVVYNYSLSCKCFWSHSAYLTHVCLLSLCLSPSFPRFSLPLAPSFFSFLISHAIHPHFCCATVIFPLLLSFSLSLTSHHHQGCCSVLRSRLPILR